MALLLADAADQRNSLSQAKKEAAAEEKRTRSSERRTCTACYPAATYDWTALADEADTAAEDADELNSCGRRKPTVRAGLG